jgi:acylphosphatase
MGMCKGILISGRVQGVGFRYSTVEQARKYSICGFVQNNPDGSVFIHAEGNANDLSKFILWCQQGPSRAIIKSVTINDEPEMGYDEFFVRH